MMRFIWVDAIIIRLISFILALYSGDGGFFKRSNLLILVGLLFISCSENEKNVLNSPDDFSSSTNVTSSSMVSSSHETSFSSVSVSDSASSSSLFSSSSIGTSSSEGTHLPPYEGYSSSSLSEVKLPVNEVLNRLGIDSTESIYATHWIQLWDSLRNSNPDTLVSPYVDESLIPDSNEIDLDWCSFPDDSLVFQEWRSYESPNGLWIDSSFQTTVLRETDTVFISYESYRFGPADKTQPSKKCFVGGVKMEKLGWCGYNYPTNFIFEFSDGIRLYVIPKNNFMEAGYFLLEKGDDPGAYVSCPT